jgi:hypothetical protein
MNGHRIIIIEAIPIDELSSLQGTTFLVVLIIRFRGLSDWNTRDEGAPLQSYDA